MEEESQYPTVPCWSKSNILYIAAKEKQMWITQLEKQKHIESYLPKPASIPQSIATKHRRYDIKKKMKLD